VNLMDKKLCRASIADRFARGQMDRRSFLRASAQLGLGAGLLGASSHLAARAGLGFISPALAQQQIEWPQEMTDWLREAGKPFAGQTIRLATESTPPSNAINSALKQYFIETTGINVEIETLPLEQVLQKLTLDVASGLGTYDLYYLDQSWMAAFSGDVVDPREKYESNPDLAMPGYNIDDFLPALVEGISMYDGVMCGVPYDIPIFIQMYRRDLYEELGLEPATTMPQYLENARAIQEAKGPQIYGTTGQMKSGHYSLECDWTCWLWGHGGSIFGPDGTFTGNDEAGIEAMNYWVELKKNMPQGVTSWTWDGEAQSVAQGIAGQVITWGEFFPSWDNPESSNVSGLMEATVPPSATSLRTPDQTGYGEIPGVGHQGGSSLAVSRYAKSPDAAWLFAQWATSATTQVWITLLGGGTGPTRQSVYDDERIKANAKAGIAGTTRHLGVVQETIANHMGSEPDLPEWAEISSDTIPVQLGRFFAGEFDDPQAVMDDIKSKVDGMLG
jgi:multiple sugar transport system substrate-binding protein